MFKVSMALLTFGLSAILAQAATVDLRILETTDLHSNMMDFDYYKDTPTEKFGLVRTATLIHQAPVKPRRRRRRIACPWSDRPRRSPRRTRRAGRCRWYRG